MFKVKLIVIGYEYKDKHFFPKEHLFCYICEMMTHKIILAATLLLATVSCSTKVPCALDAENFSQYWTVESESPDYKISFPEGCCEIVSPKGLTLWRNEKLTGPLTIEYDARVMKETEEDRLSDLNCFWMATDPKADDIWANLPRRKGIFANCATMQLYYVGYGGNYNTTTRFRRYDGHIGPPIVQEYLDADHMLEANHWYHIKLACDGKNVSYTIDGDPIFEWTDPNPLTEGWFGFRTTLSRTQIRNFTYKTK